MTDTVEITAEKIPDYKSPYTAGREMGRQALESLEAGKPLKHPYIFNVLAHRDEHIAFLSVISPDAFVNPDMPNAVRTIGSSALTREAILGVNPSDGQDAVSDLVYDIVPVSPVAPTCIG